MIQSAAATARIACALAAVLLAACSSVRQAIAPPKPPADPPRLELPQNGFKGEAGGVFVPTIPWIPVSDNHAFRPGDVLTVTLDESTQASKSANTSTGKDSNLNLQTGGSMGLQNKASMDLGRSFTGSATSTEQNALQGAVTVVVVDVTANGLLRVQGEKSLYLNQGEELIRLVGYVRATDVDRNNNVSSQRVADAHIAYSGRGSLNDSNTPGLLTRFFNSPWFPF